MDSLDARTKKLDTLTLQIGGAHRQIAGFLSRLPARVNVPPIAGADRDGTVIAVLAMDRAWVLAGQQPMSAYLADLTRSMITDWLTAYDLAAMAEEHGPARWRLNGIEAALGRVSATLWDAEAQLYFHSLGH